MTPCDSVASRQQGRIRPGAVLALFVLVAALAVAWWIITQPPRIERRPPPPTAPPLVDVLRIEQRVQAPTLTGFGRVEAEKSTMISSRVAGEIDRFAEGVVPGQVVEEGAPLAYIDRADLELALEDARAQVANAEAAVALEQAEQQRAEADYARFGRELSSERRALVLREPQRRQAEAALTQARVVRDQAALNLERATLTAPWRAMVAERSVGAGSLLSQGSEVVSLVGVEQFWVRASLPGESLEWLDPGDTVTLTSQSWPANARREGRLLSILPNLEENGLQAQLLISVDDPLALDGDGPALRLGDVLRLRYHTTAREPLIALPSSALRPNDVVWWLDDDDRLQNTTVTLVYRGEDEALIRDGLTPGQRVVTGGLAQPRVGQQVRARTPADTPAQAGEEPTP
ncbi:efflux RND transporter periplasmic adaptor subunit [Halomonas sp. HNIBRBA4712]|uniref:efflux RND transporter periplasmic adaptor subunit n=1 Tax=Halomonas sp. HNIBRBA4712 TaxID=3373087 RepID=UPI0037476BE3